MQPAHIGHIRRGLGAAPLRPAKSRRRAPAWCGFAGAGPAARGYQLRWLLMSLVISNIDTWAFLKISFNRASALIIVRLAES